jgi:hypothetical protein
VNQRDRRDLLELVEQFIDGVDQSPALAAQIEGIIIECSQDEAWFDEVSEALALFVPGGGGRYIDERQLAAELVGVAGALRQALEGDEGA